MDTERYADLVISETRWAQSVGVQSTPTMVVNGFAVIGAQPIEVFENIFQNYFQP